MKRRIGILTSGGDCPGLNAAIRGVTQAAYGMFETEIIGISDGYKGLIEGLSRPMEREEFSGILTLGGTILGTSRQPYRNMRKIEEDNVDKVDAMKKTYNNLRLDCLVTIGGNGTHKTANLLAEEGLNIVALPKTIDNDIWGTDITFGFNSAVNIATDVVDRIHTTANSHSRVMLIELMGNKAGWLTLYAGIGGGADVILLPEIPYSIDKVIDAIDTRKNKNRKFAIICVAEGAMTIEEATMKRKERAALRAQNGVSSVSVGLAKQIEEATEMETRIVIPGHYQRGGSPSPADRVLATELGVRAAELIRDEIYGTTVAVIAGQIGQNPLASVAGKTKFVTPDDSVMNSGKALGVSFGI